MEYRTVYSVVCLGGGCVEFLLKVVSHVNPDPTFLDVTEARDQTLFVAVPERSSASPVIELVSDAVKKGAPGATRVSIHPSTPGTPMSEVAGVLE